MLDDFLFRALIAGLGIAVFMGPFGALVVWRRMAFFGASVAHAALLGVAAGFILGVDPTIGIIALCIAMAVLLFVMRGRYGIGTDTVLGILAHTALAAGLVAVTMLPTLRVDLVGYLFGDVLSVSRADLVWIYGAGGLALALLVVQWRSLIAITVDEDLARVEGIAVARAELSFLVLVALVIAIAMKIVGLLLVAAMLVIPAATARAFASTPEGMAGFASLAGCLAVLGGLGGSILWDVPSGPAIVLVAALLFGLSLLLRRGVGLR